MTLRDDLIAAKALIDTPEKWAKGHEPGCLCAMAAVEHVASYFQQRSRWNEMESALKRALPRSYRSEKILGHGVVFFNDDGATSHADIMALFDRAIAAAGEN